MVVGASILTLQNPKIIVTYMKIGAKFCQNVNVFGQGGGFDPSKSFIFYFLKTFTEKY